MKKITKALLILLTMVVLVGCAKKTTSITTTTKVVDDNKKIGLSELNYDFEKDYFFNDYNERSLADTTRQGIKTFESKEDIVFDAITYEELVNIFESEGNYLILFGGSWCHNTRAAVPFINEYAKEYNITKIYNFDFYMDGTTSQTHIRNTNQSDPQRVTAGVQYNYLYGELVSRYLTNLNDYVEYKEGTQSSLTYTSQTGEDVNVAKVQVPFLFLYNKDNTINNSQNTSSTQEKFPIVYGFEEMVDLDSNGVYKTERVNGESKRNYITDEYKERLKVIFDYIKDNNVVLSEYSDSKYIIETYNKKANKEIFKDTDKINIVPITYRQLIYLLEKEGESLIYLGGSWCPNTQATIKETNSQAVSNNVIIYNFDTKLDSGYAKKYWGYSKDLHIRDTSSPFVKLYADLIEKYFTNIVTLYDVNASESYKFISYTDENGNQVKVKKLQVPYLLSYDKDNLDKDGFIAPIIAYYEEMLTLNSEAEDYAYSETNYNSLKGNTQKVIESYINEVKR